MKSGMNTFRGGRFFENRSLSGVMIACGVLLGVMACVSLQAGETSLRGYASDLSLEDLVNIKITSVSKKETSLEDAPAAVAVLTQEDFRRLGATSIPEALRAVPGLQVAQINASTWAVTARGYNDQYANKLLVMVDGRSVYTPTVSGVNWDAQDLVLEDLERIEVIRGPGATLWGVNAVNGVINIITKSAKETQGALVSSTVGTEFQPSVSARYGGQLSSNVYYRVYTKYANQAGFEDSSGNSMDDSWHATRGGLRLDWEATENDTLTFSGDFYNEVLGEQVTKMAATPSTNVTLGVNAPNYGGNVVGRWTREFSEESELRLQAYYDGYQRRDPFGGGSLVAGPGFTENDYMVERNSTWDLDMQHRFALGSRHDIVWGSGFRYIQDNLRSSGSEILWSNERGYDRIFSSFVQDDITLVEDRLRLMLGSKFEHNDYTGFEAQPAARLLWKPTEHQAAWASVARAVRTPSRLERDIRANLAAFPLPPIGMPGQVSVFGNPDLNSEELIAYEIGYRIEPTRRLSIDVAAFYNDYNLIASSPTPDRFEVSPLPPHVLISPYVYENGTSSQTYGTELLVQWQATDFWRLTGSHSWLHTVSGQYANGESNPEHQFNLRSSVDLTHGWEFNTVVYYMDDIRANSGGGLAVEIPSYVRLDVGLTWRLGRNLELAVWGQNLLDDGHEEFGSNKTSNIAEIPRTFFGRFTWRF